MRKVKSRAHYLDKGFKICGLQFGWTFIIGIIPFVGDIVDVTLNYTLVVRKAKQAEIPPWLLQRMLANNAISAGVGFIPLVGDVILATFKANSRNAALLEEFLRLRGEAALKASSVHPEDAAAIKPGAGKERGEVVPGTSTVGAGPSGSHAPNGGAAPAPKASGGFFSGVRKGKPVADVEASGQRVDKR